MQVLEKLRKISENIEIFNLSQQIEGIIQHHRTSISNRNEKTEKLMNTLVYIGLSILELSKILMYEFCANYVKPKYI